LRAGQSMSEEPQTLTLTSPWGATFDGASC
jgi:hypothetical protein